VTIFFWLGALTLPTRINREAMSALWLMFHGAPLDCRHVPDPAGRGVCKVGTSIGHNVVMALWIDDDPKVICHSDLSSGDSKNPLGVRCRNALPEWFDVYCEKPPLFLLADLPGDFRGYGLLLGWRDRECLI
jgi:hypothetical protein